MNIIIKIFKYYLRSGRQFRQFTRELEISQFYSPSQLEELKNTKLKQVIKLAYEGVPFYKNLFRERKLFPDDIQTTNDLHKLPIIDKHIVNKYYDDFKNKKFFGPVFKAETSGTTGSPSRYIRDLTSINFENAILWRSFACGGKNPKTVRATLRAEMIVPLEKKYPPFWKYDPFSKELILSGYHLSDEILPYYVEVINKYEPFDLYAVPGMAFLLADFCERKNLKLNFSAVFTSSEMLIPHQKALIEKVFNCKIFDWYGLAERVSAISQCPKGTYHVQEDYSITELLPTQNGLHEIVGTTLYNSAMPLIRYKTGDQVEISHNQKCTCGINFRQINKIHGREADTILTPDGKISTFADLIPRGLQHLKEMQVIQHNVNEVILRIVCTEQFSSAYEKKLIENARNCISKEINFTIEKVSSIKRSERGKFIPVISTIKR